MKNDSCPAVKLSKATRNDSLLMTCAHDFDGLFLNLQCGAPKIAKLVYKPP